MAARSTSRFLLALCLSFSPCLVPAGGSAKSDIAPLTLAREAFESAKAALELRIIECEKQKTILSPTLFEHVSLTKPELETALFVLNARAEDACEGDLRGKLVIAASVYRATANHYHRKPTGAEPYSEDMLFSRSWKRMEFEAKYLEIDAKQREALDGIPELRKPFHLLKSIDGLGSFQPKT